MSDDGQPRAKRASANEHHGDAAATIEGQSEQRVNAAADWVEEDERERALERAVHGAFADDVCTYSMGYVARQPLFTCLTCQVTSRAPGGYLCLGCASSCHADHELVELWSKRDTSCDCGNARFGASTFTCRLAPNKAENNDRNRYNHNIQGRFCSCDRPHPDPDEAEDERSGMAQCIVCEDWFHLETNSGRHDFYEDIGEDEPEAEFLCRGCTSRLWEPLLRFYPNLWSSSDTAADGVQIKCPRSVSVSHDGVDPARGGFVSHLRRRLCHCPTCEAACAANGVAFLLSEADTLSAYEAQQAPLREAQDAAVAEEALSSLAGMPLMQQQLLAQGVARLRDAMYALQARAAREGRDVVGEDVWEATRSLGVPGIP